MVMTGTSVPSSSPEAAAAGPAATDLSVSTSDVEADPT